MTETVRSPSCRLPGLLGCRAPPLRSCVTAVPQADSPVPDPLPENRATHPPHQLLDWGYDRAQVSGIFGARKQSAACRFPSPACPLSCRLTSQNPSLAIF